MKETSQQNNIILAGPSSHFMMNMYYTVCNNSNNFS